MDIVRGVHSCEATRFLERGDIKLRIHDHDVRTCFSVTFFATSCVGNGNHEERTLFAVGIVLVALEEATREWVAIVTEKKEFHPGIANDIVVVFQDQVVGSDMLCEITRCSKGFDGRESFTFSEEGLTIIIGATPNGEEEGNERKKENSDTRECQTTTLAL